MKILAALVLVGGLGLGTCFGQAGAAGQTDSQVLQAILVEIRGLHNDARLGQTSQILLAEMLMQQGVVTKAQDKRDNVKNNLEQLQNQEKSVPQQIAQFEDRASTAIDPAQKKQYAQIMDQLKAQLPMLKGQEQERSNDLAEAESKLRKEQDALSAIQDELNAVVKKLQPAGQ